MSKLKVSNEVVEKVLERYKNEFRYVNPVDVFFDSDTLTLSGKFNYLYSSYSANKSHIFNNTEAVFLSNQTIYILVSCYLMFQDEVDVAQISNNEEAQSYIDKLGSIVIKRMDLLFLGSIFADDPSLPFQIRINKCKKHLKGNF